MHRPLALFVQGASLLAYGCPPEAIVAPIDRHWNRVMARWLALASGQVAKQRAAPPGRHQPPTRAWHSRPSRQLQAFIVRWVP